MWLAGFCIEYLLRYMVVPGRAEGAVAILSLSGLTLAQVSARHHACASHWIDDPTSYTEAAEADETGEAGEAGEAGEVVNSRSCGCSSGTAS